MSNAEDIIGSIRDCLSDISDIGYVIQCGRVGDNMYNNHGSNNSYGVRISKPPLTFGRDYQNAINRANQNNIYHGYDHPNNYGIDGEVYDGLENDLENFLRQAQRPRKSFSSDMHRGMKTYMEIQKSISFLCSYIPDMYGIVIKSMSIEFADDLKNRNFSGQTNPHQKSNNYSISRKDFVGEPIYWHNKSNWVSLFESKLYPGILDSDIKHIDIFFEREIPESVKKFIKDYQKTEINITPKENWFKRIIRRIKSV